MKKQINCFWLERNDPKNIVSSRLIAHIRAVFSREQGSKSKVCSNEQASNTSIEQGDEPQILKRDQIFISSALLLDPDNPRHQQDLVERLSQQMPRVRSQEYALLDQGIVLNVAALSLDICKSEVLFELKEFKLAELQAAALNINVRYRRLPGNASLSGLNTPVLVVKKRDGGLRLVDGHKRINRRMEIANGKRSETALAIVVHENDLSPYLVSKEAPNDHDPTVVANERQVIANWQLGRGLPFAKNPDLFLDGDLLMPAQHPLGGGGVPATKEESRVKDAIGLTIVRLKTLQGLKRLKGGQCISGKCAHCVQCARRAELKQRLGENLLGSIARDYDDLAHLASSGSARYRASLGWAHLDRNLLPKINYPSFGYPNKKSMLSAFKAACAEQTMQELISREAGMYEQIMLLLRALIRITEFEKFKSIARRAVDQHTGLATNNQASFATAYRALKSEDFHNATKIEAGQYFFLLTPLVGNCLVKYYLEFSPFREMIEIIGHFADYQRHNKNNTVPYSFDSMPEWMAMYILQRFAIKEDPDFLGKHWNHTLGVLENMGATTDILKRIAVYVYMNFPENRRVITQRIY